MKKFAIMFLSSAFFCMPVSAQTPEKKQESNQTAPDSTGTKSDSSKTAPKKANTPKDTRMAITQKGVPSGKPKTNDAVKSNTTTAKPKAASSQSK